MTGTQTAEDLARQTYAEVRTFLNQSDPFRVALREVLQPVTGDDTAILDRVRYLLNCEKVTTSWREKGHPF